VSDIEHELIATLWDLKVAKDRIDKLTKSNLQLREVCEELKQRIKRLEDIINRASLAFFSDVSHRKVSIAMHKILEEFTREAKA
jgi:hypothetical protein